MSFTPCVLRPITLMSLARLLLEELNALPLPIDLNHRQHDQHDHNQKQRDEEKVFDAETVFHIHFLRVRSDFRGLALRVKYVAQPVADKV